MFVVKKNMKNKKNLFLGLFFSCLVFPAMFLFIYSSFSASDAELDINFSVPHGSHYCGDGIVDIGEDCDGSNLNNKSCINVGSFGCGTLACNSDCTFNISACKTDCPGGGGDDTTPPVINLLEEDVSISSAKITWTATDDSGINNCLFSYNNINGSYASSSMVNILDNNFWVDLINLENNTEYFYKITCQDNKLNTANYYSEFKTLEKIPEKSLKLEVYARPKNRKTDFSLEALVLFVEPNTKQIFKTILVSLNSLGYYKNEAIELPIYTDMDVFIKGRSHLAKKISGIDINNETTSLILNFTDSLELTTWGNYYLMAGDTQGIWPGLKDNIINVLDLSAWDIASNQNTNILDNDLNNDGRVDVLDVSIIEINLSEKGDILP